VTDASAAVITGVQVRLTDPTIKTTLNTTTNDAGRYLLLNVPPGTYNITFSKPGFSTYEANRQQVQVGQVLTINPALTVGATTTTVEVSAVAGAELQTTNATVGQTLSGSSLTFLPNLGREAAALTIYQPGVRRKAPSPEP